MIKRNYKKILLFLVFALGFLLRFVDVGNNPASLNWDEVSHGYNAYSVLKTGEDEWGQFLPLTNFRAYGDYPLPLNLYLTAPFVYFLGLTEFSIRLPHVLLGSLIVLATFFLVYGLRKNYLIALLSSFLVAIDPWGLFLSRFVVQSNLAVFFLVTAITLFLFREKSKYFLVVSFILLGLSMFSYHTTRIFTPVFWTFLLINYFSEFNKQIIKRNPFYLASFLIYIIFMFVVIAVLTNPNSRARSKEVFLINDASLNEIIQLRLNSNLPKPLTRLIYNRPVYLTTHFVENYLIYFSPERLFLKGGTHYQFSIPDRGVLNPVNIIFFYIGVVVIFSKIKSRDYRLIFGWMLLAVVPASLTQERFAVVRASTLLPLPEIMSAFGFFWLFSKLKKPVFKNFLIFVYLFLSLLFLEGYLNKYFTDYRKNYSWAWQYGYKEVVLFMRQKYDEYDRIIVTKKYGEPHEFLLFYWPWDPLEYRQDTNLVRYEQSGWFWVDSFDKFYFVNDWDVVNEFSDKLFELESGGIVDCMDFKCLLITSPGNFPSNWHKIHETLFLDGKTAFEYYEN